jgi:hypothetical protein
MKTPAAVSIVVLLLVLGGIKGSRNGFFERFGKAASGTLRVKGSA